MSSRERFAIRAAVFLGGATLMAAEVAAFRIIGKSFGSALRETTAVIAVFLTAMSIGYWLGGKAGDRWPQAATLAIALLSAAVSLFVVPWLDAAIAPRLAASAIRLSLHAFIATAALFALPTAFLAAVSPIAVRLFITSATEGGSTSGSISAISTTGSIAGAVATAFFVLDWLESITRTVLFLALVASVVALGLLLASSKRALRYAFATAALFVVVAAAGFFRSSEIDASLLREGPGWKVLFAGDSPYHHVVVRQNAAGHRILTFGIGEQTWMDVADPFGRGALYSDSIHISKLIRPRLRRVLLIGLGGGTVAKQFTHEYAEVIVDAVEVDPMVVSVASKFFFVTPDARLRVHTEDGRTFLRRSRDQWDFIIVDAYTTNRYGATVPPHLITQEFFREVASHLTPGGMVHYNCAFGDTPIYPALQKTMASVFDATFATGGQVIASNEAILTTKETLLERARKSPASNVPNLERYIASLQPVNAKGSTPLLTDDYAPVETLLRK